MRRKVFEEDVTHLSFHTLCGGNSSQLLEVEYMANPEEAGFLDVPNDLPLMFGTHLITITTRAQTVIITANNS